MKTHQHIIHVVIGLLIQKTKVMSKLIRNSNKKKGETDKLLHERIELKTKAKLVTISNEMKMKIEDRMREIEDGIDDEISENYHKEIKDTLKKLGGDGKNLNGSGRKLFWKLLSPC